jgi:hypothetical protein
MILLQSGRLSVLWLEASLVCTEQASYQQGTDVRAETTTVWRERVLRCERFRIENEQPFQRKCLLTIPTGAMHSLACPSNEIRWSVVVCGEADGWPAFERWFPIVVYPPRTESLVRRRTATAGTAEGSAAKRSAGAVASVFAREGEAA